MNERICHLHCQRTLILLLLMLLIRISCPSEVWFSLERPETSLSLTLMLVVSESIQR